MIPEFQYKEFEPDDRLTAECERVLERVQDLAPTSSTVVSQLEFDGVNYSCAIDVFLKHGSVYASTSSNNSFHALHRAEETIIEKLSKQKETQFFTRKPSLTNERPYPFEPVGQT